MPPYPAPRLHLETKTAGPASGTGGEDRPPADYSGVAPMRSTRRLVTPLRMLIVRVAGVQV